MFGLQDTAIDIGAAQRDLADAAAGAYASFEGWVRNHNEGKDVLRLAYEAYPALAVAEGKRILDEARKRFGLLHARCIHRTGDLAIGDCAVWVGVTAPHRGEAFAACRYIIDEVKHRVPIWKKEFYLDGDSGWVNCERCAHAPHAEGPPFSEAQLYARQVQLAEIGEAGQQRLRDARVVVVGAGGLGAAVLPYLASAGVGTLGVVDGDLVEASNLHRQPIYGADDVGQPKAERAGARMRTINPFIDVRVHAVLITAENADVLLRDYDVVVDATDNFEAKYLLSDAAVLMKKTLVQASVYQYEGQLSIYAPGRNTPCLRCLWPEPPAPNTTGACADTGVIGVVPAALGVMQATEVLKVLLDLAGRLENETLFHEVLSHRTMRVRTERNANCPACGDAPTITNLDAGPDVEVDWDGASNGYVLVDMRQRAEADAAPIPGDVVMPLPATAIDLNALPFERDRTYLLCCPHGWRSKALAQHLRRAGFAHVYSLRGGVDGLRKRVGAGA